MKKKILFISMFLGVILLSASIFRISKADTFTTCNGGTSCRASTMTVSYSYNSSTITISGTVQGGYYNTVFTQCSYGNSPTPPEPLMDYSTTVSYSVDGVSGTIPVTVTQNMIQPGPDNNCAQQPELGTYSKTIANPNPAFPPYNGSVNFLDAQATFGSVTLNAQLLSNTAPVPPSYVAASSTFPVTFNIKNIGPTAWTSDQSSTAYTGTCSVMDGAYKCPSVVGSTCTTTKTYWSSVVMLKHISGSFGLSSDPTKYNQTVTQTCKLNSVSTGGGGCVGQCSSGG